MNRPTETILGEIVFFVACLALAVVSVLAAKLVFSLTSSSNREAWAKGTIFVSALTIEMSSVLAFSVLVKKIVFDVT